MTAAQGVALARRLSDIADRQEAKVRGLVDAGAKDLASFQRGKADGLRLAAELVKGAS